MTTNNIPTDRPLTESEVHGLVCQYALKRSENDSAIRATDLVDVGNLGRMTGIHDVSLQAFRTRNAKWTVRKLSEFVNRLIARGILSRAWDQPHSDGWYFISEYGISVLKDIASLLDFRSTDFVESLRDPELRSRCGDSLNRTKNFDSMVRDSIAVLQDRLTALPGVQPSGGRRSLAVDALSPKVGAYTLGDDDGQKESAQLLYQGVLGFFGNPLMHGLQEIDPVTGRQIVGFVDTLLDLLTRATKRGTGQ